MREFSKTTVKVVSALESGRRLTSAKLRTMGLTNPSATIWNLRHNHGMRIQHDGEAYYVDSNKRAARKG